MCFGSRYCPYSRGLNIDEPLGMLRSGARPATSNADGLNSVTSLNSAAGALARGTRSTRSEIKPPGDACAKFACAGLESNFEHRVPQISKQFLRMNAIIGIHAGGFPWLQALKA